MGKHALMVVGPAGSGKSTYCAALQNHANTVKRVIHVINLDPAAETFNYNVSVDIRDLISLEDVMSELELGPNGGLIYCMEYLMQNISWLAEKVADYEDDFIVFDCPGQIELYSHIQVMPTIARQLQSWGYNVGAAYCIDSLLVADSPRFIAGTLMCLSAMISLELPHVNLLTKSDLVPEETLDKYLDPESSSLIAELNDDLKHNRRFRRLNESLGTLIEDYSMVSFLPCSVRDEEQIELVQAHIDHMLQYGEDLEVKEPVEGEDDFPDDE